MQLILGSQKKKKSKTFTRSNTLRMDKIAQTGENQSQCHYTTYSVTGDNMFKNQKPNQVK
jgi:hypothetical protein